MTPTASIDRPRVAVLFNGPVLTPGHPDSASEAEVVATARAIVRALRDRGARAWLLPVKPPLARLVRRLTRQRPDVVFNLIEGYGGRSAGEEWVTSVLELLGLPYTGCPPEAQALCRHKGRTKALLRGEGLPTAAFAVVRPGDPPPSLPYPVILKPAAEDASLGVDQASVVRSEADLEARLGILRERYGPEVLVEEYLPGREFNVGVVGLPDPTALPIAEVIYQDRPGLWPVLTYEAKWREGSVEDMASPVKCPADLDPSAAARLGDIALAAFRATGCRDYARVDMRLDARGEPMILEVNPNPSLDPHAGLARAIRASGRDYAETVLSLVRIARERGNRP